jgi:dTDP-4-dehydrorhamnose reductase
VCNEINAVNVYISTDYVFDGAKGEPYEEEDIPNPINVYGLSKYTGEVFTRNYSEKYYVIRVASLYGKAGARGKGGNFVDFAIRPYDLLFITHICMRDKKQAELRGGKINEGK